MRFNQALGIGGNAAGGGILNAAGSVILRDSVIDRDSPGNCSPPNSVPGCRD